MNVRTSLVALCSLAVAACSKQPPPAEVAQPGEAPDVAPVQVENMPAASAAAAPAPSLQEAKKPDPDPVPAPVLTFNGAFATPESVLYDPAADRYLVSNINGKPDATDGNGYISELNPDGSIKTPKLIASGEKGAKLDAPKGLAIVRGELWVADITRVRRFDLKTLDSKGDIALPNAVFANDVALAPDGRVFVSDTSVKAGDKGMESTGGDQVFVIDKAAKARVLAQGKELAGPNGLAIGPKGGLWVNTMQGSELYRLTDAGKREDVTKLPSGGLDGLLVNGDTVLCSSWAASAVFRGKIGGSFEPVIEHVKGAADIGWDSKRSRLLVPRFLDNRVEVYELK